MAVPTAVDLGIRDRIHPIVRALRTGFRRVVRVAAAGPRHLVLDEVVIAGRLLTHKGRERGIRRSAGATGARGEDLNQGSPNRYRIHHHDLLHHRIVVGNVVRRSVGVAGPEGDIVGAHRRGRPSRGVRDSCGRAGGNVQAAHRCTHWGAAVDAVVGCGRGYRVGTAVQILGRHAKGRIAQNQEIRYRDGIAYQVVGRLRARDKLVVVVVCRRCVRRRQGGYVGRACNRIGGAAIDLNANREGRRCTAVALVHDVNLVGSFLEDNAPVGPAAAAVGVVGGKEDPVLAVWGRPKRLLHDNVIGARASKTPNAHRLVGNATVGQGAFGVGRRRNRCGVKGQYPRGADFVVRYCRTVEVKAERDGVDARPLGSAGARARNRRPGGRQAAADGVFRIGIQAAGVAVSGTGQIVVLRVHG